MLKTLRDLQGYCELIMYTFLPREFVDRLVTKIPDLNNIFSYIFCAEDMAESEEYLIKDLSQLMFSRDAQDLIIIETQGNRIDEEVFSSIILQPYDGSVNYN